MKILLKIATALTAAAAAPAMAAGGADPKVSGRSNFTSEQAAGYVGSSSKAAITRESLDRLRAGQSAAAVTSKVERLLFWHKVICDAIALDHTPDPDTGRVDLSAGGPGRTGRALAMTEIAVYDAVNSFERAYEPYNDIGRAPRQASKDAAIAYAAHDTLVAIYPAQKSRLDRLLAMDVSRIVDTPGHIATGRRVGQRAAEAMKTRRAIDNSFDAEANFGQGGRLATGSTNWYGQPVNSGSTLPFEWTPDPLTPSTKYPSGINELALGAFWGGVTPFALNSGDQFRVAPPPSPGSPAYIAGFDLTKTVGAAVGVAGSTSTAATRFIGNYWGYDGAPLLGTPPRLYNQIAIQVARSQGMDDVDQLARYLALLNAALGDAGIAVWDSKYYYNYWRPVTAVRRGDEDGVPETTADPAWKPVGVSIMNTAAAINATPPFPAYPSGHSTFGATTFEAMRGFFPDATPFTFVSDEYNGKGVDPWGAPRPLVPVRFRSFTEAQQMNGISRIDNGVHWTWDDSAGQAMGVSIAQYQRAHAFQPR